jgi:AcrR family transcriptional regulator
VAEGRSGGGPEDNALYRRIIRAAEERFKKVGFRGLTMEAVARDAAVSKPTLYSHFKNKDELFMAVSARLADLMTRTFLDALHATGVDADERIESAIVAKNRLTYTLVRTSPHADDLFSTTAELAGDLFVRADEEMLAQLTVVLAAEPPLLPQAPRLARALIYGSGGLAAHSPGVADLEADLATFVRAHLTGARAVASPAP